MKIIALVTEDTYGSTIVLNNLRKNKDIEIVGIIESTAAIQNKNLYQSFLHVIEYSGSLYLMSKVMEYLSFKIGIFLSRVLQTRKKRKILSTKEISRTENIPLHRTSDINGDDAKRFMQGLHPELLVSIHFNQILKKDALAVPTRGCINLHPGPLPKYRGLNAYFWVLFNSERYTGTTVHHVDEGIDTGKILEMRKLKIGQRDGPFSLLIRGAHHGHELIHNAIKSIREGKKSYLNYTDKPAYYSIPSKKHVAMLRKRGVKLFSLKLAISIFR